jgi:hypothetical protein
LSAGSHSLMAAYLGDANHLASDSSLLSHAVNAPALSIADTSVLEGHSNTSFMHFTVALSQASSLATTVSYATADGTAKAGSDYVAASGQLTLPAGATQGSLDVGVIGDRKRERHETFTMTLSNPSNAALPATATATGTILNDDRRKRSDLNGDGKDDILWRKVGAGVDKGAMFLWLMDQLGLIGSRYLDPISEDWQVAFLGDLNGDGKTDVVWRNIGTGPDAGKLYVWMMDGPNVIGGTGYTAAQADLDWRVEAVGDLNGDGTDDILWRKIGPGVDKGAMFLWLMDGVNLVGARYLDPISEDWQVIFVGDLNGDGMTDIVWRNLGSGPDAGKLYIWMMDGPNLIGGTGYTAAQADLDWRVEAVGDLNGDGKDDILWRKIGPGVDKGAMFLWLMNDTGLIGARYLDPISEDWQVVFVGDLNGDGKTDVVWRNFGGGLDAGKLYVWIMDGPNVVGGTGYTAAQADLGWRVDVR